MSSFKKNRSVPKITDIGKAIVEGAEDTTPTPIAIANRSVKEITIPFTKEMSDLLEKLYMHFDGDISRRKLCAKYLLKALRTGVNKFELN